MANSKTLQALISIAGQVDPSLQKSLKQASNSFGGVKKAAAITGVVAVAGVAAISTAAVKATSALYDLGTEFDAAKDTIRVGTGATGKALDSLYSDMKEVYKDVPTTMEDASSAISDYNTRLGLTGEPLQEISQQAIQVSDMLGEDLTATVENSSKAFQQWGINSADMSDAMDYIFKVSQSTGMGFNDLMTDMQSYGAQLQVMGYSFNESAALMGQLEKAGVNTSEVLGAMKKSVSVMASEGLSASEGLQQYYNSIMNAKNATEATTIASEVFGKKAGSTMAAAIRNGTLSADNLTASLEGSSESINAAAKDTYDFAENFQLLKQNAQTSLEPIASSIVGLVNDSFPYIQEAMDRLMPLFAQFAEGAIPVIKDIAGQAFPLLVQAASAAGNIFQSVLPQMSSLLGGIFAVVQQIAPVIFSGISKILPALMLLLSAIVPVISSIFSALSPVITIIGEAIASLLPQLAGIIVAMTPVLSFLASLIGTYLSSVISGIVPLIQNIMNVLQGLIGFISNVFAGNWSAAWQNIVSIFSNIFMGIINMSKIPLNAVISVINSVINSINGFGFTIPDWVPVVGGNNFTLDIPNLPTFGSGGFTDGPSLAGEAGGTEAVISFDPAYRQQNLSYWAKAGQMLGATDGDILSLIEDASGSGGSTTEYNLGGVTFSPNITISGSAQKQDVLEAIREAEPEFFDLLDEYLAWKGREAYGASY